jgi:hypothetical protein
MDIDPDEGNADHIVKRKKSQASEAVIEKLKRRLSEDTVIP